MSHVRIERLGTGDREEDRAERKERAKPVIAEKPRPVQRIERREDDRVSDNVRHAEHRQRRKPQNHDGPEHHADAGRAPALRDEHADQNHDSDRHHDRVEYMRGDAESFDGAEHRDGRRNHAVAIEQGGSEQSHRDQRAAPARGRLRPDQRDERENTALALVVGAQHEQEVLHRHDQNQRPHDQREDAEHVGRGYRNLVRA
jgi:hypothetical protein